MFVTFLCGVYEPATGRLILANAGHCRPVLIPAGEAPCWAVPHLGTALGFEPGLAFDRTELMLHAGDSLVLYTDGVGEAFNAQEQCYGNVRLLEDVGHLAGTSPVAISSGLLSQVRSFAAGAPQSDDIAILTLTAGGPRLRLQLAATPEEVMRGVEALQQFASQQGLAEREVFGLALALEECGSNIVNHALQRDSRQHFQVLMEHKGTAFELVLRDAGPEFDPTAARPKERSDDDEIGGWGLQLVRRHIDEMHYGRQEGANVLRLTKRLAKGVVSP
jgi:sigma-B regulation protein RsbU (phosphoserine phosphatase)